jgi:hypothetical protein
MPDITMCSGDGCPIKETCYRYKATPTEWQSYFSTPPFDKRRGCQSYWEMYDQRKSARVPLNNA